MLEPAILYKEELAKKSIECWYKPEYFGFFGLTMSQIYVDDDDRHKRQFASINNSGEVIGYIAYDVDWAARSAARLGAINFSLKDMTFIRDLCRAMYQVLCVEKFNRLEWWCFADNPAVKGYRKFIKRIGGDIVGHTHQCCLSPDGTLHDSYLFEIMQRDVNHEAFNRIMKKIDGAK